jgi:precorrin-2/cobalt-factor-2 C20-methyltransferase
MLIGISLGPGDPGLLTIRAVEALRRCKKVFVPGELAAELARPYCKPEMLEFPMIEDPERLEGIWSRNADLVARFAREEPVGFACIGDVNTFSTFGHLRRLLAQRHPGIELETIPGVGVVPALASRFGVSFERSFEVSDGSPVETIIRMKATRPREMAEEMAEQGLEGFVLGVRLFTTAERIIRAKRPADLPEKSDYISVLYARRRR